MHDLEARARAVVGNWEFGNLSGALDELEQCLRRLDHDRDCAAPDIARAHELYESESCAICESPLVSRADGGTWISAWVFVPSGD